MFFFLLPTWFFFYPKNYLISSPWRVWTRYSSSPSSRRYDDKGDDDEYNNDQEDEDDDFVDDYNNKSDRGDSPNINGVYVEMKVDPNYSPTGRVLRVWDPEYWGNSERGKDS